MECRFTGNINNALASLRQPCKRGLESFPIECLSVEERAIFTVSTSSDNYQLLKLFSACANFPVPTLPSHATLLSGNSVRPSLTTLYLLCALLFFDFCNHVYYTKQIRKVVKIANKFSMQQTAVVKCLV